MARDCGALELELQEGSPNAVLSEISEEDDTPVQQLQPARTWKSKLAAATICVTLALTGASALAQRSAAPAAPAAASLAAERFCISDDTCVDYDGTDYVCVAGKCVPMGGQPSAIVPESKKATTTPGKGSGTTVYTPTATPSKAPIPSLLTIGGVGEVGDADRLRARMVHGVLKGLETFTQRSADRAPALGAPAALVEHAAASNGATTHPKGDATPALDLRVENAPPARSRRLFTESPKCFTLAMRGACTDSWLRKMCPYTCGVDIDPDKHPQRAENGDGSGSATGGQVENESDLSAVCEDEMLKIDAEAAYRHGEGVVWFEHVQKSGGHLFCSLARAQAGGARDLGPASCCCGNRGWDQLLAALTPGEARALIDRVSFASPGGEPQLPTCTSTAGGANNRSALDILLTGGGGELSADGRIVRGVSVVPAGVAAARACVDEFVRAAQRAPQDTRAVRLVGFEWATLAHAPAPGQFVYALVAREPIARLLSWSRRFNSRAWQQIELTAVRAPPAHGARGGISLSSGNGGAGTVRWAPAEVVRIVLTPSYPGANAFVRDLAGMPCCPPVSAAELARARTALRSFSVVLTLEVVLIASARFCCAGVGWRDALVLSCKQRRRVVRSRFRWRHMQWHTSTTTKSEPVNRSMPSTAAREAFGAGGAGADPAASELDAAAAVLYEILGWDPDVTRGASAQQARAAAARATHRAVASAGRGTEAAATAASSVTMGAPAVDVAGGANSSTFDELPSYVHEQLRKLSVHDLTLYEDVKNHAQWQREQRRHCGLR